MNCLLCFGFVSDCMWFRAQILDLGWGMWFWLSHLVYMSSCLFSHLWSGDNKSMPQTLLFRFNWAYYMKGRTVQGSQSAWCNHLLSLFFCFLACICTSCLLGPLIFLLFLLCFMIFSGPEMNTDFVISMHFIPTAMRWP